MSDNPKQARGVTLIEMVMMIVLVGILVGLTAASIRGVIDLYNFWSFRSESVSQARLALMRMVREIRQVNNETSILIADRSRLTFNDTSGATINYYINGTDLIRNSDTLASGVTNLAFGYYNETNATLGPLPLDAYNRSDIFIIGINVTVRSGDQNRTVGTVVGPRNL